MQPVAFLIQLKSVTVMNQKSLICGTQDGLTIEPQTADGFRLVQVCRCANVDAQVSLSLSLQSSPSLSVSLVHLQ